MKKVLAILALALFIGGLSAPVIAANSNALTLISLQEEDPKKKETKKKAKTSKEASKSSSDCDAKKKSDCSTAKKADCCTEKKTDCSKK